MKRARFRVYAPLDVARPQQGTVTIDRKSGLVSVRPLRRRREYVLPLATVASMVVARVLKAELFERRLQRAAANRRRNRRSR